MRSKVEESFTDFFEKWMAQLEECAQLLLIAAENEKDHEFLVNKLTTHYKNYYTAKWAAAREDVLAFFAPVWLTSLESAYLWVTGWKPSTAFRLVAGEGMSEEQMKKVEVLRGKIKAEEEKVEREMERQQVAMADRRMVELARLGGGDTVADVAVKNMLGGLEKVMKMADCVRLKTLKGLLDVMGPTHSIHFLASASMLQIQMRKCGKTQHNLSLITNSS
ncbi:PREDICTED: protein DOG1-like 4 [Ipomoea nil]|uniref:protein DOG1-like 4 n=1 Tax=Ipomoea nil TaxID=35883 RepID=UPI000900D7C5|nr:PREDICTED: protein DOG1-like 4 [Ipomoea nil]